MIPLLFIPPFLPHELPALLFLAISLPSLASPHHPRLAWPCPRSRFSRFICSGVFFLLASHLRPARIWPGFNGLVSSSHLAVRPPSMLECSTAHGSVPLLVQARHCRSRLDNLEVIGLDHRCASASFVFNNSAFPLFPVSPSGICH